MKNKAFYTAGSFVSGLAVALGVAFITPIGAATQPAVQPELVERAAVPEPEQIHAGIVPHHLVAEHIIDNFFQELAAAEPDTIVLVGPDHWGKANKSFTTTPADAFFDIPVNTRLRNALLSGDTGLYTGTDEQLLTDDHGLYVFAPFIKKHLPDVKIVPIAVGATTPENRVETASALAALFSNDRYVVVSSTDFSHYLPSGLADFHDQKSLRAIEAFAFDEFSELELDCWQCIYFASYFADIMQATNPELLAHANSAKILEQPDAPETTSYAAYLFKRGEPTPTTRPARPATFLFTGDIMLGRHVETLMRQKGGFYPFEDMHQLLRGIDVVHGNLEGPVVTNHYQTPSNSTSFSFSPNVVTPLNRAGFDVLALGNNHSLDRGHTGFSDTYALLSRAGIRAYGHATDAGDVSVHMEQVAGQDIVFLSFNDTFPFVERESMIEQVRKAAQSDAFVIVNVHWGIEYRPVSYAGQQELARAFVDAGANAVVGHHPHVVQEVELYNGAPIFYSLGNFVFDQYFSTETQEGLVLALELWDNRSVWRLAPVKSELSQPRLMTPEEAKPWLADLAERSDESLREQLEKSIIVGSRVK